MNCPRCDGTGEIKQAACPECDGDGVLDVDELVDCPTCRGRGYGWPQPEDPTYGPVDCLDCDGTGGVTPDEARRIRNGWLGRDYTDDEIKGIA